MHDDERMSVLESGIMTSEEDIERMKAEIDDGISRLNARILYAMDAAGIDFILRDAPGDEHEGTPATPEEILQYLGKAESPSGDFWADFYKVTPATMRRYMLAKEAGGQCTAVTRTGQRCRNAWDWHHSFYNGPRDFEPGISDRCKAHADATLTKWPDFWGQPQE